MNGSIYRVRTPRRMNWLMNWIMCVDYVRVHWLTEGYLARPAKV
jgi:hypothetical protein